MKTISRIAFGMLATSILKSLLHPVIVKNVRRALSSFGQLEDTVCLRRASLALAVLFLNAEGGSLSADQQMDDSGLQDPFALSVTEAQVALRLDDELEHAAGPGPDGGFLKMLQFVDRLGEGRDGIIDEPEHGLAPFHFANVGHGNLGDQFPTRFNGVGAQLDRAVTIDRIGQAEAEFKLGRGRNILVAAVALIANSTRAVMHVVVNGNLSIAARPSHRQSAGWIDLPQ